MPTSPTLSGNPRSLSQHRERGPKRFTYTWADIERATGKSRRTLQRWAEQNLFDPADFASVLHMLQIFRCSLSVV